MHRHLINRNATGLVRIGRRILDNLAVDPRLAESAATLEKSQGALEAKISEWQAASGAAASARTERDRAHRILSNTIRDFAFGILSVTGNHHDADPYLRYLPEGYGAARTLVPVRMIEFVWLVLAKLEDEVEPRILAGRDALAAGLGALEEAQAAHELAAQASADAFGVMQAEKRNWTRGLALARALAGSGCFYDHGYVRALFAAAAEPKRRGSSAEEEVCKTSAAGWPRPAPSAQDAAAHPRSDPAAERLVEGDPVGFLGQAQGHPRLLRGVERALRHQNTEVAVEPGLVARLGEPERLLK